MLTKYAAFDVIEAKVAREGGALVKDAHRHSFDYEPEPGFLYVRSRAISSRTNDNFDHFPAEEIRKSYRTFVGKPVFVNHNNEDHLRARGVIRDAVLHEDTNPDGSEDTWVEVLMEIDAVNFPRLAQAIIAGEIDRTSMGCDIKYSVCSVCGNKAETPLEYCNHIPAQKGMKIRRRTASGSMEEVLCYEKCVGLSFFENSLLVEEPADPTAYFLGVDDRGMEGKHLAKGANVLTDWITNDPYRDVGESVWIIPEGQQVETPEGVGQVIHSTPSGARVVVQLSDGDIQEYPRGQVFRFTAARTASKRAADDKDKPKPKDEPVKVPAEVDTLRDEQCPVCGETDSWDGNQCLVCQYTKPPDEFMDPDTERAKEIDLRQEEDAVPVEEDLDAEFESEFEEEEGSEEDLDAEFESEFEDEKAQTLKCDNCGYEVDLADDEGGFSEGDTCPNCGEGTLQIVEDEEEEEDDEATTSVDKDFTEEFGDEEDEDKDKKKSTRHRSVRVTSKGAVNMRPTLATLAAYDKKVKEQNKEIAALKDALRKKAQDDENPGVPEGWGTSDSGTEAPTDTSEFTPSNDDVETPGGTSETDVSPDAQGSVEEPGATSDEQLDLNELDVTAPVEGTDDTGEGPPGEAGSGRTEVEVRVGDPTNPQEAFPVEEGGWTEGRFVSSMRLARLRIAADVEQGEDLVLAQKIAGSEITDETIQNEIETLTKVVKRQKERQPTTRPVARRSQGSRTVPSLSAPVQPIQQVTSAVTDDELLFE